MQNEDKSSKNIKDKKSSNARPKPPNRFEAEEMESKARKEKALTKGKLKFRKELIRGCVFHKTFVA